MPDDSWLIPQMLLTDADIALSFADMAANHHDPQTVEWTTRNAAATYRYIVERRRSVSMSDEDAATLESKLSGCRQALI